MKEKLLLCGNYGVENVGDEAILRALIQKYGTQYEITVMSANPTRTAAKVGVKAVEFWPTGFRSWGRAFLTPSGRHAFKVAQKILHECDVFMLGGGTLLTDEPLRSLWIWGKHLEQAYRAKKRVWIEANGIGPLRNTSWAGEILRRAEQVTVRDAKSMEWCKRLGVPDARQVKDPVFEWSPPEGAPSISTENAVIFAPRYWTKNMNNMVESFSGLIRHICLVKGKKVIGIPFEKSNVEDVKFLNTIFEQSGAGERATIWKDYVDEIDVYNAIRTSDGVVGMRLHSLIFAAKAKVPFVGISYMDKVAALGEELGKSDAILPLEGLSGARLVERFEKEGGYRTVLLTICPQTSPQTSSQTPSA